jgi:hypothetical protein
MPGTTDNTRPITRSATEPNYVTADTHSRNPAPPHPDTPSPDDALDKLTAPNGDIAADTDPGKLAARVCQFNG